MQTETIVLRPGDAILTKRALKRCREAGFEFDTETEWVRIGGNRWGAKIVGYAVPASIYKEEVARRELEKRRAEEQEEARLAKLRKQQIDQMAALYPKMPKERIADLVDSRKKILSANSLGYQNGVGSKAYWKQLGFVASGEPNGVTIKGGRLIDVYLASQIRPKRTRMSVESLLDKLLVQHGDERLVLAHAIRIANRLQKVMRDCKFYELKDRWIKANQSFLVEGLITRVENKSCWSCGGSGDSAYPTYGEYDNCECESCCGTGVYSNRTLFEHRFDVLGQPFVFHSYVTPEKVSGERGANVEFYGRPFSSDELPCPPQSVVIALIERLLESHGASGSS